jgi:hypothetical protein
MLTENAKSTDDHSPDESRVLVTVIDALRPLPGENRVRIVESALLFLGTPWREERVSTVPRSARLREAGDESGVDAGTSAALPRRAQVWLSQSHLALEDLDDVFYRTGGGVRVIATQVPGRTNKDRTCQCYLLSGVRALLESGNARFDDSEGRQLCRELGCFDSSNHMTYLRATGNHLTGSKDAGFELTQPGLRAAAELVRSMTGHPAT